MTIRGHSLISDTGSSCVRAPEGREAGPGLRRAGINDGQLMDKRLESWVYRL